MRMRSASLLQHEKAEKNFRREARVSELMMAWEAAKGNADVSLRWNGASKEAGEYPEICVKNPLYVSRKKPG